MFCQPGVLAQQISPAVLQFFNNNIDLLGIEAFEKSLDAQLEVAELSLRARDCRRVVPLSDSLRSPHKSKTFSASSLV